MNNKYDYSNYGSLKDAESSSRRMIEIARRIGVKNRYLRYLRHVKKNQTIIELGCGNGAFIKDLLKEGFKNVKGVEPSDTYVKVVESDLIVKDFAYPYLSNIPDSSLGAVIAWDVFEHIPQTELKELIVLINSRLSNDGILIFRVPNMASPLGLLNYFGDLSHVTALNEISIRQLAFEAKMELLALKSEPFSYPRSLSGIFGIMLWPIYKLLVRSIGAAFGLRCNIMSPNLVCILKKMENIVPHA